MAPVTARPNDYLPGPWYQSRGRDAYDRIERFTPHIEEAAVGSVGTPLRLEHLVEVWGRQVSTRFIEDFA